MNMTHHERPGVYSSYDASAIVSGSGAGKTVGLVGVGTCEEMGAVVPISRQEEAVTAFDADTALTELVRLLLINGAADVRAVTSRTKTGEASDITWRELTTIRIVGDVIPTVRNSLRSRFNRAKNTEQSRGAIRAQVIVELENKLSREIITGYDAVTVSALDEDPTVCLVEFSFTVAHGLNQIWLSAHITV